MAVITNIGKIKLAKARAGDISLPAINQIAFGDGTTFDSDGDPIDQASSVNSLKNELLRKNIDSHTIIGTGCRYVCRLEKAELAGQTINEVGLIDSEGDFIAIKSFANKTKDKDMPMVFEIDDKF
jgi:phage-related tail fiber protein